jgi:hypothetical protein
MPLPEQVINQLSREPADTPGWSFGLIFFSGALLVIVLAIYFGMTLAYEPYLNTKIAAENSNLANLSQSISAQDEANVLTFYSQIANLQGILAKHTLVSQFLAWLEQNTEANVSYSSFSFSSGGEITLSGNALTEADVNQQIAIFQSSPDIENVVVSNVGSATSPGSAGAFQFSVTLLMNPSVFTEQTTQ